MSPESTVVWLQWSSIFGTLATCILAYLTWRYVRTTSDIHQATQTAWVFVESIEKTASVDPLELVIRVRNMSRVPALEVNTTVTILIDRMLPNPTPKIVNDGQIALGPGQAIDMNVLINPPDSSAILSAQASLDITVSAAYKCVNGRGNSTYAQYHYEPRSKQFLVST